ncbi:hypothetical protein WOLCODRAFT_61797 [Wolfiporia cocos MD-104 SS10]|uniref:DUF1740-domain-containing protein n=1 Tax=Wolfiporia cocos (strain MD-104) TaxID=742152 RepID=A0A2H3JD07_WOLCO|nr:hypothetical protein WOLCODRAFT_61797 [Wolfiporia cocos MD-104 SS10]
MSAPSFSSFPPTFSSFPDLDPGPSKSKDETHQSKKRSKKEERGEDERKQRKRRREKGERGRSSEHGRGKEHSSHSRRRDEDRERDRHYGGVDDERAKAEEDGRMRNEYEPLSRGPDALPLYITDRKGDPLNVRYGGLHAGSVPRYHLVGGGRTVLGLGRGWTVVYRGGKGVEIALGGKRRMHALTDSSTRHLLNAPPKRRLLAGSGDQYKYEEQEGFLRLPSGRSRKDDQSYRAITAPKGDADSDSSASSSDNDGESSDDDSDTSPHTSLQETLKTLEEQLTANPSSISTWLLLLSHTLSTIPITSKNAPKARSEITLSILSRALSAHPDNVSSKTLRLKYLKAGEEVWQESKLRTEWEDAVKTGGTEIWIEWLDWRIRRGEKGMDGIVEDGTRVLAAIDEAEEVARLRIVWRVAVAFRDAGYVERANALFQAQAEFAYRIPPGLIQQPFQSQLDALEEYWESEGPRIGEPAARSRKGWPSANPNPPVPARKPIPIPADSDPFRRWSASESLADRTYQLPTRSFDAAADADPYATILFSDIRPLLVPLRTAQGRDALRLMWLAFLGLHVPGFLATLAANADESTDDRWASAHLASPAYLQAIFPQDENAAARRITADAQAGVLIGREREYSSGFGPVKSWGYGVRRPLEGAMRMWAREDVAGVDAAFVREVFAQCRFREGADAEWDVLALAFEAALDAKAAVKVSKTMLASAQESLVHWTAHARLERLRSRLDDARKIYQTVLIGTRATRFGQSLPWWDWVEMEWLAGQPDAALEVITRAAGAEGTSGIAILKARRFLAEATTFRVLTAWEEREAWIKLSVLLELTTSSPQSALTVADAYLAQLTPGQAPHESMTVALLAILHAHGRVLRNPMPPALLQERALDAIKAYPSNTFILGIFLEAEKGHGIWGRVRGILGESAVIGEMKEKDLARRVAEVWMAGWEKGRWEAEQERTRGGLSAAVQSDRTRGSAALWRVYLEFEIRAGQLERAKKLVFRAVGECPLAKELYLLAFGALRSRFSSRELREWGETMAERGIRMRTGLDEVLEGQEEQREEGQEGEEYGEEDIEENARELRRLMPY